MIVMTYDDENLLKDSIFKEYSYIMRILLIIVRVIHTDSSP